MSSPIYYKIGKTYNNTRSADPRIANKILDVGAGTVSYSKALADAGFSVTALEPSEVMLEQDEKNDSIQWVKGVAESLPFEPDSFDAVIFILCLHHFKDLKVAFNEAQQVTTKGKIFSRSLETNTMFTT